ncbi:ribbon-helix-helix domain-containing protein [Rothia sp. AR01]|uniref:Ribbon-helix-helix domain-containing protein n=1 Tax=Rothia santali TaxID=2949643 RepID=A0A9X2HL55_9MICC|nr:ribbon-helix-helix domain-containing protein [Rothia santali]MCP3426963.1 ribbon-helix-helix domain-containing protein [Rothia santali]
MTIPGERYYEQLADDAEAGDLAPAGPRLTGEAARRAALALFRETIGTDDPDEIMRRGRPRLAGTSSTVTGASPRWNLRVSEDLNAAVDRVARESGRPKSEVIRQLVARQIDALDQSS